MKFRTAIFDLDGTLLNTLEDIADSYNTVFEQNSFPVFPVDHYRKLVGSGARNLLKSILPDHLRSEKLIDDLLKGFSEVYSTMNGRKTRPYPGMVELLDALHGHGISLAVLSNKPHPATEQCVATHFAPHLFVAIQGHTEGAPLKPDPSGALAIMRKLSIAATEAAFIGDTPVDLETALAANLTPIGVTWGFRSERELRAIGDCAIVHSADQLKSLLLE